MEAALKFYRDILGFEVYREMDESGDYIDNFYRLKGVVAKTVKLKDKNGGLIELLSYSSHISGDFKKEIIDIGISHFALTVDDIEDIYNQMKEQGVTFNCSPQNTPDGYAKVAFCRDFDGNFIELVEIISE